MRQTLFAFLALMLATYLSYNQQRSAVSATREMVDTEMEVMASGIALQVMEYIGHKAFDHYTTNDQEVTNVSGLTAASAFGPQQSDRCDLVAPLTLTAPYQDCDDIDDFHEIPTERVPFLSKSDTMYFDVTASVRYVTDTGTPTSSRTFNKEVTVIVKQTGANKYLQNPISLTRTFSYERLRRS
jgi:hypothetical protein